MLRWKWGLRFQLGQEANARVKLAAIHNEANLELGEEANNEACVYLEEPHTQAVVPVGAAANNEASLPLGKFNT